MHGGLGDCTPLCCCRALVSSGEGRSRAGVNAAGGSERGRD
jgi:hypothetical protein